MRRLLGLVCALLGLLLLAAPAASGSTRHAIIFSASRGWLNYRHTANALAFYNALRE